MLSNISKINTIEFMWRKKVLTCFHSALVNSPCIFSIILWALSCSKFDYGKKWKNFFMLSTILSERSVCEWFIFFFIQSCVIFKNVKIQSIKFYSTTHVCINSFTIFSKLSQNLFIFLNQAFKLACAFLVFLYTQKKKLKWIVYTKENLDIYFNLFISLNNNIT